MAASAQRPRAVVIGFGYAGRAFHSYLISLDSGLELYGIQVRDPGKRDQARDLYPQARLYEDVQEVLDDPAVDLVVLATPNATHCDLAIRALEAGKHVVTDKIMCLDLDQCDRMIAASQASGRLLSVFQNRRWDGDFLTLRSLLDSGRLGRLRWYECAWQGPRPMRRWRAEAAQGGGRFYDLGAHLIDQCLLLFPQAVTSIHCRMHFDHPEVDTESHALLTLGFEDGATAVVDTGSTHFISKPRIYAVGSQATFQKYGLDPQEAAMQAGAIDAAREPEENYGVLAHAEAKETIPTQPGRWRSYYEGIAAQLSGGEAPVHLEEARRVMAVVDAARRSAREGRSLEVQIDALS